MYVFVLLPLMLKLHMIYIQLLTCLFSEFCESLVSFYHVTHPKLFQLFKCNLSAAFSECHCVMYVTVHHLAADKIFFGFSKICVCKSAKA